MTITVKPETLKSIIEKLKKIDPAKSDIGQVIADRVRGSIKTRIQSRGIGLGGVMKYKEGRYKQFRKLKGYTTNFKNLTVTGNMLNSMIVTKRSNLQYTIGIGSEFEKIKAQGNQEREEWFGITDIEIKAMNDAVLDYLRNIKL